jgi:hypothetical protein
MTPELQRDNDRALARKRAALEPPPRLTILEARSGILAKRYLADGSRVDFGGGYHFAVLEVPASTWDELLHALTVLVNEPSACIVRGAPVEDCPRTVVEPDGTSHGEQSWVYRRVRERPGEPANFVSVPRRWVVFDFDETIAPFDLARPEACIRAWHSTLPAELREARSAFFASASAHTSPTVRGKLVTWYDREVSEALARAYAVHYGADPSVAGAVQPNYFAAPLFDGCTDPLPSRAPIVFDGCDATPPPRAALRATRKRPAPVPLAELPPGDSGIVAALGRHEDHVGRRFLMCGATAGVMRKLMFSAEHCEAVLREWLPGDDPTVDVERGIRWARGAWEQSPDTVSGEVLLRELVGKPHADVIVQACIRGRRARVIA